MRVNRARVSGLVAVTGLAVALASIGVQAPLTVTERMVVAGASTVQGIGFFLSFFTIWTNMLVALTLSAVLGLVGGPFRVLATPRVFTGVVLAILLVAIVFHVLLSGLRDLSGLWALADFGLHTAVPALMAAWWLVQPDHGRLTLRDPFLWTLWPLGYLAFALIQSLASNWVPYPFLDHFTLGWARVVITCAVIAMAFIIGGYGVLAIDRLMAAGRTAPAR